MDGFTTEIDVSITGDQNGFPNGSGGRANIKWKCEFQLGESKGSTNLAPKFFGIKGMIITVPEQEITFMSSFYDEETDEETEKEVTLSLKDVKVNNDLGQCNIAEFELLPVELEVYKDKFELRFS